MKNLSCLLPAFIFLTAWMSGCDPAKTPEQAGDEQTATCPKVQKPINFNCSGPDFNRTCVATWTVPTGVNSFRVEVVEMGQSQPHVRSEVQGSSFTIDSLQRGKSYQFKIQSACAKGKVSAIVIDDLVRK